MNFFCSQSITSPPAILHTHNRHYHLRPTRFLGRQGQSTDAMEDSPFSFSLWCRSVGLTPFETATAVSYLRQETPPTLVNEVLVPHFDSRRRKSSFVDATSNLVATMIGGCILGMPLAFEKCGIILGSLLIMFAAIITDRSLCLLCICARQCGVSTYGQVGRVAFGPCAHYAISSILVFFLLLLLVAYMALVRDIIQPVLQVWIPSIQAYQVLLGLLILWSPFFVQRSLHSLRFICYASIGSVSILSWVLCRNALDQNEPVDIIHVTPIHLSDALAAFPVIMLTFLSSFNVLYIQSALNTPTLERMQSVVHTSIGTCLVLTYLFGLAGYLLYADTGNILHNLDQHGVGRIASGFTVMVAMTLILVPCRDNLLELLEHMESNGQCPEGTDCQKDSETADTTPTEWSSSDTNHDFLFVHEGTSLLPPIGERSTCDLLENPWVYHGSTLGILGIAFVGTNVNINMVWRLCGPTLAYVISFALPAACYLELERRQPSSSRRAWVLFSWFLLIFSLIGAICCTVPTISSSLRGGIQQQRSIPCTDMQTIWHPCL